jgi:circadian clock protein KaiA
VTAPSTELVNLNEPLVIGVLVHDAALAQALHQRLPGDRYRVMLQPAPVDLLALVQQDTRAVDCLILADSPQLPELIRWLLSQGILLPTLILQPEMRQPEMRQLDPKRRVRYHAAEIYQVLDPQSDVLADLAVQLDRAIQTFMQWPPAQLLAAVDADPAQAATQTLVQQQQRLANKLRERLGYMGVYYKRDPELFARSLPIEEREQFFESLKESYREIILTYFNDDTAVNRRIDAFVDTVFFADLPVSKVVEIHMDLIEDFAKQLKLEGRSEEVLLDYRLTLIDSLAHLCEMYRRSIPREIPDQP